jgi:hypothetical protein
MGTDGRTDGRTDRQAGRHDETNSRFVSFHADAPEFFEMYMF